MKKSALYYKSCGTPGKGSPITQAPGAQQLDMIRDITPSSTRDNYGEGYGGTVSNTGLSFDNKQTKATFRPGVRFGNYRGTAGLTLGGDVSFSKSHEKDKYHGTSFNKGANLGFDFNTGGSRYSGIQGSLNVQGGKQTKGTSTEDVLNAGQEKINKFSSDGVTKNYLSADARLGFGRRGYTTDGAFNVSALGKYDSTKDNKFKAGVEVGAGGFSASYLKNINKKGGSFNIGYKLAL